MFLRKLFKKNKPKECSSATQEQIKPADTNIAAAKSNLDSSEEVSYAQAQQWRRDKINEYKALVDRIKAEEILKSVSVVIHNPQPKIQVAPTIRDEYKEIWHNKNETEITTIYNKKITENPSDPKNYRDLGFYYLFFGNQTTGIQKATAHKLAQQFLLDAVKRDPFDTKAATEYETLKAKESTMNLPAPRGKIL